MIKDESPWDSDLDDFDIPCAGIRPTASVSIIYTVTMCYIVEYVKCPPHNKGHFPILTLKLLHRVEK